MVRNGKREKFTLAIINAARTVALAMIKKLFNVKANKLSNPSSFLFLGGDRTGKLLWDEWKHVNNYFKRKEGPIFSPLSTISPISGEQKTMIQWNVVFF